MEKYDASAEMKEQPLRTRWEGGEIIIESADDTELSDETVRAIESVRRAIRIGASLVDSAGFTFKITMSSPDEDLNRLSEVITARAGALVQIISTNEKTETNETV